MDEVEYLTEWPPKGAHAYRGSTADSRRAQSLDLLRPASKRPRHGTGTSTEGKLSSEEVALAESEVSQSAGAVLARWWKLKSREPSGSTLERQKLIPASSNPHTLLCHIGRFPEARQFLRHRADWLEKSIIESSDLAASAKTAAHVSLASCYQRLGRCQQALEHARSAAREELESGETQWLCELLERQCAVEERIWELEAGVSATRRQTSDSLLQMPKPTQVARRCVDDLSFREFFHDYALTRTPVVITGMVEHMTPQPWTLGYIKQRIGHKTAPLRWVVPGSVEWARLEPAGNCRVADFIDSLDDSGGDLKYLFDWSLPLNCPELARELKIPRYFAGDFLQRTPRGALYHDSWPSLFVAPAGICSELHVDAFGSNFWMALFEGKKRWVFFPPEDTPCLYPVYEHSTDAIFQVDLTKPDLKKHPLLAFSHPRECLLQAGEILFVPAGCPHRVENLERSLAISANFVDKSNFEAVVRELRGNSLVDEQAKGLLRILESEEFDRTMDEEQLDLYWEEFKTWPRAKRKPLVPVAHD